ncbi:beta-lactamase/transpeptidase-like protein [Gamsiella multidivaricata]|uniref:beta-lactamase/transpeptidase-like protein n=1 Tax=Gamsiella multidivaricata TaxID=101098 RepID=UPI002220EC8D|nr:beta-lactamase/transpeptidase-like protein [Gamsiella multidivaricata]KAI7822640.1 beta-lactamase/transpeptidase-like protein [Gamsiella multidivaricata]
MQLPSPLRPTKKPLANLHDLVEKARIQCGIPGMSVAVLYKDQLIFAEGFGKRNEQEPFTVDTISEIGSLTKAFTATAIGEMVAEGKMDWDKTPVNKFLPEFELKDPVLTSQLTLVDLLSHRTGLPDVDLGWYRSTLPRRELIKRLRHVDMTSKLGSKTQYNNVMFAVAGEAAANVAGIPYEDLVQEKVLSPLGLTNTGFSPMEMKKRSNHAMSFSAASIEHAQNGIFKMNDLDEVYASTAPAGDMHSNVLDLVRWGKTVMNTGELNGRQILNKDSIRETLTAHSIMTEPRTPEFAPVVNYGLGWWFDSYKGQVFYRHSGSISGFRSNLTIFPHVDLVIAQLFNIFPSELGPNLAYHIADDLLDLPRTQDWLFDVAVKETKVYYDLLAGFDKGNLPEPVPNQPPAHAWQAYVGAYFNPVFGEISVRLEKEAETGENALFYRMGHFDGKLEHYHFDAFVLRIRYSTVMVTSLVMFQTGGNGKVAAFVTEFDEGVMHEFKRKNKAGSSLQQPKEE